MQAHIRAGESAQGVVRFPPCFKSNDRCHCQMIKFETAYPYAAWNQTDTCRQVKARVQLAAVHNFYCLCNASIAVSLS